MLSPIQTGRERPRAETRQHATPQPVFDRRTCASPILRVATRPNSHSEHSRRPCPNRRGDSSAQTHPKPVRGSGSALITRRGIVHSAAFADEAVRLARPAAVPPASRPSTGPEWISVAARCTPSQLPIHSIHRARNCDNPDGVVFTNPDQTYRPRHGDPTRQLIGQIRPANNLGFRVFRLRHLVRRVDSAAMGRQRD